MIFFFLISLFFYLYHMEQILGILWLPNLTLEQGLLVFHHGMFIKSHQAY